MRLRMMSNMGCLEGLLLSNEMPLNAKTAPTDKAGAELLESLGVSIFILKRLDIIKVELAILSDL